MNWKTAFSTNIGKKLIVGATGLFLVLFLIVHCYINAQIFFNDGGARFNELAHFMGTNPAIRIIEIGLFVFLIWHAILGLILFFKNKARRSVGYAVTAQNKNSKWYSRSMAILGILIMLFLIVHLRNFWGPNRYEQTFGSGEIDLFSAMASHFSNIFIVLIYLAGCVALGWHLAHGVFSVSQTFGLATHRYKNIIKNVGVAFAIIVPLVFAMMPIWFYAGSQGWFDMHPSVFMEHVASAAAHF
ncbi:MAG: succinate dehydrogenase cytochrome b subunit [Chitinophagaceae bacterium]